MGKHLHIDPFSGIAGDMFLGAMIDLGLPLEKVEHAFAKIPTQQKYKLTAEKCIRCGVTGIDFKVHIQQAHNCCHSKEHHETTPPPAPKATQEKPAKAVSLTTHSHDHGAGCDHKHDHGHGHDHSHTHHHADAHQHGHEHGHSHPHHDHGHHHVHYRDMLGIVESLDASDRAKSMARKIVNALADAEATVHGKKISEVHFHEVGGIDSMIDMLGAAVALDLLDVTSISCGPIPVTHGFVRCDHGRMPLPAPATALLLRNKPVIGLEKRVELVTPTGAAIIAGLCDSFGPMPAMTFEKVGYGAGDRDEPDTPNMLRLFLGTKK